MSLSRVGIARAWNLFWADVHRGLAWVRDWQAGRHRDKARAHDRRADADSYEPTELDGGVR
jgi:hypothetical protein